MPVRAPLGEHFLDIVKAQSEPGVEQDRVADDAGRETVTLERELTHRTSLGPNYLSSQPSLCDSALIWIFSGRRS